MLPQNQATYQEFIILKTLSSQKYKLKLAIDANRNIFALKFIDQQHQVLQEDIERLSNFRHSNIASLISFRDRNTYFKKNGQTVERACLIYEYVKEGELFYYVTQTGPFTETLCRCYFKQIVEALSSLHNMGIAHESLSAENILFEDVSRIKISDLGISYFRKSIPTLYCTPEFLLNSTTINSQQQDIFAAGVILYTMMVGIPPFNRALPNDQNYQYFAKNQSKSFWQKVEKGLNKQYSEDFKQLIGTMFAFDPIQRLSLSEILNHKWMEDKGEPTKDVWMIEFQKRQKTVEMGIEMGIMLQRFKKLQNIRTNQERAQLQKGIGKFRNIQGEVVYEQDSKRELRQLDALAIKQSGIEIKQEDVDDLLRIIIEKEKQLGGSIAVSDKYYKIKISYYSDDRNEVEIEAEFYKVDDKVRIEFCKVHGDTQEFFKRIEEFHQFVAQQYE